MSVTLVHCSSAKKVEAPNETPVVAATQAPVVAPILELKQDFKDEKAAASSKELDDLKISLKKAEAIVKKEAPAAEHEAHGRKIGSISADKSLGWLKNGNIRFAKGTIRNDGATKKDISRLASGQAPHAIVLSCSDSRVPPEVVFDQKLGEIFVVRVAGQSLDDSVIASIEYAVEHLGSNLILVMGHSSCGAIKEAFTTAVGADSGSPYLNALVAEIQPRIATRMKGPASESFVAEGWDNARGVTQALLERSSIIREAAKSGSLRVETALYHLKSGLVEWK